jgi:hypothetical protein
LFWALDKGNNDMLNYLWNFDKFKDVNWGVKNLEFMMLLANDLQDQEVFKILLSPKSFSTILKNLTFSQAMDFIEDHIIHNGFIEDDLKLQLLNSDQLIAYAFVGAFLHISSSTDTDCEEAPEGEI